MGTMFTNSSSSCLYHTPIRNVSARLHQTKADDQVYLWNSPNQVEEVKELRLPTEGEQRHPTTVAPEELVHGLLLILKSNIEVSKEVLMKEVAKMLGYSRISKENMKAMEPAR